MEEFDAIKQNYELAFHINGALEEANAQQIREDLEKLIVTHNGTVTHTKVPERTHLSYPIRHQHYSYFGYIQFSTTDTQEIAVIEEQLKLNNELVRYIILKMESDAQRQKAMSKMAEHQEKKERREKKAAEKAPAPENKEMEKQLEDIIGNL